MESPTPRPLEQIRRDIDAVDLELVSLLERRVALAREVGHAKGVENRPYFVPEREHQIFERLRATDSTLSANQLIAIFREVVSAARAAEKPLMVAYWGPEGTFTHQAAMQTFGRSTQFLACTSIREVFLAAERGQADYGIVPIENSIAGIVPETLDMFPQTSVKICSESFLDVHHYLGSHAERLEDIRHVYAGPQPGSQCRRWLSEHLPHAPVIEVVPTSMAAIKAAAEPHAAAIANQFCLELYGLPVVAERIEDVETNRTRFVVLGFNEPASTGRDKTSLMFTLRNRPGELHKVLGAFVEHHVNLTMIESRPSPRASFEYTFYADAVGHRGEENVMRATNDVRSVALDTLILGSYPSTDPGLNPL